jgi:hypothetical protein
MPKIQWSDLPPALRDQLFEGLRDRKIAAEDLYQLRGAGTPARAPVVLAQRAALRTTAREVEKRGVRA